MDQGPQQKKSPQSLDCAGDLFGELHLADSNLQAQGADRPLLPGLLICGTAAIAAAWLAEHYGFPLILMGLMLGMMLSFAGREPIAQRGLDFASRVFLQTGIVVLGVQVTAMQIVALGVLPFLALGFVMSMALAGGLVGARVSGQSRYAGVLAGGATAICGASAALAIYSIIGKRRLNQTDFTLTLVGVSLASAVAMSIYPPLAVELGMSDRQAGFIIGASVHDVAQAIGGGYAFSDAAGAHATIVKLARVAMLAPLVALLSLVIGRADGKGPAFGSRWRRVAIPWFITGFLTTVALNSIMSLPSEMTAALLTVSKSLLLVAVTATAMRTRLDLLRHAGWRRTVPVLSSTISAFVAAIIFARIVF